MYYYTIVKKKTPQLPLAEFIVYSTVFKFFLQLCQHFNQQFYFLQYSVLPSQKRCVINFDV